MNTIQNRDCINLGGKYIRVYGWSDFLDRIQQDNPNFNFRRKEYARK